MGETSVRHPLRTYRVSPSCSTERLVPSRPLWRAPCVFVFIPCPCVEGGIDEFLHWYWYCKCTLQHREVGKVGR